MSDQQMRELLVKAHQALDFVTADLARVVHGECDNALVVLAAYPACELARDAMDSLHAVLVAIGEVSPCN